MGGLDLLDELLYVPLILLFVLLNDLEDGTRLIEVIEHLEGFAGQPLMEVDVGRLTDLEASRPTKIF
ncbi:hypothetical protein [Halorussus rarus]|uniref:hypothetical protein n=1 Tax=Halorussus rarus TaxID=660515 RepID=UPI000E20CDE6|nr:MULTISPECIES: hypothetical protein [Halorussus]NHN61617.1 hypothetical protein [Halorussus sp. JP-T4]